MMPFELYNSDGQYDHIAGSFRQYDEAAMQYDETDRKLMALLRDNARTPVVDLARALGLARTTVQARIARLEQSGAILGYTLRQGAEAGPAITATILLQIEPRSAPHILNRLKGLPGILAVFTTSGRYDLLVEAGADSPAALDALLDDVTEAKGVRSSESLVHLATKIDRR